MTRTRLLLFVPLLVPLAVSAETPSATPNVNFNAAITHADGRVVQGHVVRIERSQDFYAEKGWVDTAAKLTVTLEGNGAEIEKPWTDIATIDLTYGGRTDVDCVFDSDYSPWMYTCTLKTTSTAKTTDGKAWTAIGRHKWRFVFEDGTVDEFWVNKFPGRLQDENTDPEAGENHEMYAKIQAELMTRAGSAVTRIAITK